MPGMKQLIFFTESFPYGKGESFIENEIEYLSREFDRIYILPKTSSTQEQRSLPAKLYRFPSDIPKFGGTCIQRIILFQSTLLFFQKIDIGKSLYFSV